MPTTTVLKIRGAAPFTESRPSVSIDVFLNEWLLTVESRFPHDPIDQVNVFGDVIPRSWESLFLPLILRLRLPASMVLPLATAGVVVGATQRNSFPIGVLLTAFSNV